MTDTSARLLRLLSLLQTPREWPGVELADRLAVTPRTVRRDIERLRDLGYPVHATRGAAGGYRLVAGRAMPPLLLDDEEAVAIAVGLRTAAGHAVDGIEEASVRALAKLEQVLPSRLRHRVRTLGGSTVPLFVGGGPRIDPEVLATLAATAASGERLRFRYAPAARPAVAEAAVAEATAAGATSAGEPDSARLVEPYGLVSAGRRWYFVAYDVRRDDWRTFRVDRVTEPHPTGVRTTPRQLPDGAEDAAAFVRNALWSLAPTHQAVATLHAPAAQIRARLGDRTVELTALDAGTCRLRTQTDTLDWLAFQLVQLGCEFEVHEPPELITHLRDLGARVTRAVDNSGN
ncbi:YafY family transcriptional regulator [Streptomyces armeniacus]|uniref:YafY family transcriptional regulator n=1 Tax=Streptomyces armeniacus TaxID=83291 RepID=A0A345XY82_9ACTN|nr:YafY family protein [Streptomyces armeniacus]AXK36598.1 YafY family transcriptional regulator [Streptomyces armeniacus]